ncbi:MULTISPECIES: Spy/CpxP family protein refolding chaperone [unclassified Alteromonas]|uniref:Spy/CpxP family protein refolding chaperone n=1 Tax=unclassified Alteromonas TaxID=2614992 RepID=UPI000509715D|nr:MULTISPECIES: Spy/CpxP family protein refolding chaperone [unclassified Alteromonas]
MKRLLITTAIVATVGISGFAYAKHHDTEMRHHQSAKFSVKQMVKQLRGLSLSEVQKSEIKALVTQFKEANSNETKGYSREERRNADSTPRVDLATATDAEITEMVTQRVAKQSSKQLEFATLRHDVFAVLTTEQQAELDERHSKFEEKRERKHERREQAMQSHKDSRGDKQQRGKREMKQFAGLSLSDEQKAEIAQLIDSQKESAESHRETVKTFKQAQRDLVRSDAFSEDAFIALSAKYEDDLIAAGVEKVKFRSTLMAVLTDEQQEELKSRKREMRGLMDLIK